MTARNAKPCAHGFITPDVCPVCQMIERVRKAEEEEADDSTQRRK